MSEKHTARLAAFMILERDGKVLLARRCNTGYADGMYQFPAGHIEKDEFPDAAAIREAKEETGVDVALEDVAFVHTAFRINRYDTAGDYIDFFFKTSKWRGEPVIGEPEKCDDLLWAPLNQLPDNTIPSIKEVASYILAGRPFSQISSR